MSSHEPEQTITQVPQELPVVTRVIDYLRGLRGLPKPAEKIERIEEETLETIPIPLKGIFLFKKEQVRLIAPEETKVDFQDRETEQLLKKFCRLLKKVGRLRERTKKFEGEGKMADEVIYGITEERDWRGLEAEEANVRALVYLGKHFVRVRDAESVKAAIPERYRSQLLTIKTTPPSPPESFLAINYHLYRQLLRKGEALPLPKGTIDKPEWKIKFSPLHK